MKKRNSFIQFLLIVVLILTAVTACDKTDDPVDDFTSMGTVRDADFNVYNTVKIGSQVWTVENLKTTKYSDGSLISNITNNETWHNLTTGAYCNYDNLESNVATYGRLYNWYAVNTGKLAPTGWHVPTDNDWTILENYLIANGYNFDKNQTSNMIAKSLCAKTNWALSTYPGSPGSAPENNNRAGFTAFPGGYRHVLGTFELVGECGSWWSSTEDVKDGAFNRNMDYDAWSLLRFVYCFKANGFSVRLVRD